MVPPNLGFSSKHWDRMDKIDVVSWPSCIVFNHQTYGI